MKAIATAPLNIRQSNTINSDRIGGILKGTVLEIGDKSNNYVPLLSVLNGYPVPGYVSADYVTTSFGKGTEQYTTDVLNVRNSPNITGYKFGQIKTGKKVTANFDFQANGYVLITMPFFGYVLRAFLNDNITPVPIPPTPQNKRLVGLHVETPTSNAILLTAQRLYNAGKPFAAITILDDIGLANELAKYVLHVNFRSYPHGNLFKPSECNTAENAKQHANFIYDQHYPVTSQLRGNNITVQFRNENSVFPYDNDFELQLMVRADHDGKFKVGMYGDSVGTPNVDQWQTRIPSLAYATAYGHKVIIHEYSAFQNGQPSNIPLVDPVTRPYYGLRHEMLYNSVPANCRPLCIIGECGLSSARPDTIEDLKAYNQLLLNDPYVVGFCIWGFGATRSDYNANPMLPAIEQLMLSL